MSTHLVLDNTLGAMFIGVVLATSLHGIALIQTCYYYTHQSDKWPTKLLVAAVMVCDTVHQALITHTVYIYTITNWGDVVQLGNMTRTLLIEVLFNALTAFLVQSFLTLRVWRLSHGNIFLTTLVVLFVLVELGSSTAFTIMSLKLETFEKLEGLRPLSLAINALAAAGDVLIAGTLFVLLNRSRTGFQRSDTMINKLILFTVNTGLLTSLCAVASFISYLAAPKTFIYISFYFCIGRLYTNALLATLNARKMIRNSSENHANTSDKVTLSLRDMQKNGATSRVEPHRGAANISIKINTTRDVDTELADEVSDKIEYLQTSNSSVGLEER